MADVRGSGNVGGNNQTADNDFGNQNFWYEWIEIPAVRNLSEAGFNISDGSLGGGQTVYNAGGSDSLDIPAQSGTIGRGTDTFAVRVSSTLTVSNGGTYNFRLDSDDGARLYIDGQQVVNHDGLNPAGSPASGSINLGSGQHEIVIIHFENAGGESLTVDVLGPDYGSRTSLQNANVQANTGNDQIDARAGEDTIDAGAGNDTVFGGDDADSILGGSGDDTIEGGDGNDTIDGGSGNDTIDGGSGNDSLFAGAGDDSILGGAGNDTIAGSSGADFADGGSGDDQVFGDDGDDTLVGGSGDDTIAGGIGADLLGGGDGNDTIFGGDGNDTVDGGNNNDAIFGGTGNDSLSGGDGDDTILADDGNDTVLGDAGADSIDGGTGFDSIDGGTGADTLLGADGDDTILGSDGDDSIDGGTGADILEGGNNNDTIAGGDGEDTLRGGEGDDNLTDSSGNDQFFGDGGNDTIDGGFGNDSIEGGTGDDRLLGGSGDDVLDAGEGNDQVDGGAGSDIETGGDGFDTFVVSAGDDTITDFNTGAGQDFDDGDQSNNDFLDLAPYYDDLFEMRRDFEDDGLLNQSVATDDYSDNTSLPGTIDLGAVAPADLTFDNVNLVCFTPGVHIETPQGPRAIETIAVGDMVTTLDRGYQPVRWIGRRTINGDTLLTTDRLRPIRIRKGALGQGLPRADLVVSPQHRMLVSSPIVRRMFGVDEIVVAAKKLIGLPGIERDDRCDIVTYIHILLDNHEILFANGAPAESLFTGPMAIRTLEQEALQEIADLFPEILDADYTPTMARLNPPGRALRTMVMRHEKNGHLPLETFIKRREFLLDQDAAAG